MHGVVLHQMFSLSSGRVFDPFSTTVRMHVHYVLDLPFSWVGRMPWARSTRIGAGVARPVERLHFFNLHSLRNGSRPGHRSRLIVGEFRSWVFKSRSCCTQLFWNFVLFPRGKQPGTSTTERKVGHGPWADNDTILVRSP